MTKRKITENRGEHGCDQNNWIGNTWCIEYNDIECPSLNQISKGLIAEAMVQLKLAMGNVKDQKHALAAQNNIKTTWRDLLNEAKVEDRDEQLKGWDYNGKLAKGGIYDPTSPV